MKTVNDCSDRADGRRLLPLGRGDFHENGFSPESCRTSRVIDLPSGRISFHPIRVAPSSRLFPVLVETSRRLLFVYRFTQRNRAEDFSLSLSLPRENIVVSLRGIRVSSIVRVHGNAASLPIQSRESRLQIISVLVARLPLLLPRRGSYFCCIADQ